MTRTSFLSPICLLLLLVPLALFPGCKAKVMDPGNTDEVDLSEPAQTCEEMRCVDADSVCCNGEPCVDTKNNPQHCGACGKACRSLEACAAGTCVCRAGGREQACAAGTGCCPDRPAFSGGCKNLDSDTANCGNCGRSCRPSETCKTGSCSCGGGAGCSGAQTCCGMACANLQDDAKNCGMCGKQCAMGKACKGGVCEGECTGCAMGETCCNGKCANLGGDAANCGMCGKKCGEILGIPLPCIFGICVDFGGGDMGMASPDGFTPDM